MAQRFDALEAAASLGGNNEFLVDQDGLLRRITYNVFSGTLEQTASAAGQAAVAAVSGNLQAKINTLQTSVNELTSNLAIVSNIAQGALGGGVTKVSTYTLIGESSAALRSDITSLRSSLITTSAALRDDITSVRTKHTSVASKLSNTSVALRDDISSVRTKHTSVATLLGGGAVTSANLGVVSAALRDDITSVRTKHTSVASKLSNTSVALRDDISSVRTKHTSVASQLSGTSIALRDDITSVRTKHTSVASKLSNTSVALRDDITSVRTILGATSAALSDRINTWTVESTTGGITATSVDSGKLFVFTGAGAKTITLTAAMPLGWNITMLQLGTGAVSIDTAVASTSLVNASTHRALNNYGSGAVLAVAQQEGTNSHAWYWLQGETQ